MYVSGHQHIRTFKINVFDMCQVFKHDNQLRSDCINAYINKFYRPIKKKCSSLSQKVHVIEPISFAIVVGAVGLIDFLGISQDQRYFNSLKNSHISGLESFYKLINETKEIETQLYKKNDLNKIYSATIVPIDSIVSDFVKI